MKYYELKLKQQKEFDDFPLFFAFNDKQFAEGMQKFNLDLKDTDKIFKLPGGCFIKKESSKDLSNLIDKQNKEFENLKKSDDFLLDAMIYELANHEYCITYDSTDTINALDIDLKDKRIQKLFSIAKRLYLKNYIFL